MPSTLYSAFGNRTRTKLLYCLFQKPKTVSELVALCDLSQSAISQHLAKLKNMHLVVATKVGKTMVYSLKHKQAGEISALLISLEKTITNNPKGDLS